MTEPVQFSLSRRWIILLAVSLSVSTLLFFSAGIVGGLLLHAAREVVAVPVQTHPWKSDSPKLRPATTARVLQDLKPAAPDPVGGPRPAQLAVEVTSFEDPARAQSFADSLKRQGFPLLPVATVRSTEKTWHTVRVGPYSDWDTASRAAAGLGRTYNLQAYVVTHEH